MSASTPPTPTDPRRFDGTGMAITHAPEFWDGYEPIEEQKWYETTLQTEDATATPIFAIDVPLNTSYLVETAIIGVEDDGATCIGFRRTSTLKNVAGTVSVVDNEDDFDGLSDHAGAAAAFATATSIASMRVVGALATVINWKARYRIIAAL